MNVRSIEHKLRTPAVWALVISLVASLVILFVYFLESGSLDDVDETLFFLLALLRYSAFLVSVCSLYLLAVGIYRIIRKPSVVIIVQIILFFCSAMYGIGIILIDTFILSITAGNG